MSPFSKLLLSILGLLLVFTLFTATSYHTDQAVVKELNKKELIRYITQEVNYEKQFGDDENLEEIVDKAMIKALKQSK